MKRLFQSITSRILKGVLYVSIVFGFYLMQGNLYAQESSDRFNRMTIEDGLSQNYITSIIQDKQGFMWLGTFDGINRYDGTNIWTYHHIPNDDTSLISSRIDAILEDSRGWLWVAGGGLNIYDPISDRFVPIISLQDFGYDLLDKKIFDVVEDKNGKIWFYVEGLGLMRLSIKDSDLQINQTGLFGQLKSSLSIDGPFSLNDTTLINNFWDLHFDDQWIYVITWYTIFKVPIGGKENQKVHEIPVPAHLGGANQMFSSNDSTLYIASSRGILELGADEELRLVLFYEDSKGALKWQNYVRNAFQDNSGTVWIVTNDEIKAIDLETKKIRSIEQNNDHNFSQKVPGVSSLCLDRSGQAWIGTTGMGVNIYSTYSNQFNHLIDYSNPIGGFSIYGILVDKQDDIWAIINEGLLVKLVRSDNGKIKAIPYTSIGTYINDLTIDSSGNLWCTAEKELLNINPITGHTRRYQIPSIIDEMGVNDFSIYIDPDQLIWLCNSSTLNNFNPETERFETRQIPGTGVRDVEDLIHTGNGNVWIASESGLMNYNWEENSWVSYTDQLSHHHAKCLLLDTMGLNNDLWIGTAGGGLNRLDLQTGQMIYYSKKDGLSNNTVYGIQKDSSGSIWASTNYGLNRYDVDNGSFKTYFKRDGIQSNEFNTNASFKTSSEDLLFGGINGITRFNPHLLKINTTKPQIAITDVHISGKPFRQSDADFTFNSQGILTNLVIDYRDNNIKFTYCALDFVQQSKNRFKYKLAGFDKNWSEITHEQSVTYHKLPPGSYTFMVIGTNNDGVWSDHPVQIKLKKKQSIWLQWPMLVIYALVLIFISVAVIRLYRSRVKVKKELVLKKLEAQKLEEFNAFKSRFVANISHEFRTPISLMLLHIEKIQKANNRTDLDSLSKLQLHSNQLIELVDQLLDLSRIDSDRLQFKMETGDLVLAIKNIVDSFQALAIEDEKSLQFKSDLVSIVATFDNNIFLKIVSNLITNALKFTPHGGIVDVNLDIIEGNAESTDESFLSIEIRDNGIGIPENEVNKVFDRFYQRPDAQHDHKVGFGLGLALVKELVTMSQGEIHIESSESGGTQVLVLLPCNYNIENSEEPVRADQEFLCTIYSLRRAVDTPRVLSRSEEMIDINRSVILLVEDNFELSQLIREELQEDFSIVQAENGQIALDRLKEFQPDLIITDLMMPEMGGDELISALKSSKDAEHIPLIVLTAVTDTKTKNQLLELGVNDFLLKPFSMSELRSRVRNTLTLQKRIIEKARSNIIKDKITPTEFTGKEGEFLKSVRTAINTSMSQRRYSVESLANELNISTSQLNRKLKLIAGITTIQLMQKMRLKESIKLLRSSMSISEVAYSVGYQSPAHFTQRFKTEFGVTPSEFRKIPDGAAEEIITYR